MKAFPKTVYVQHSDETGAWEKADEAVLLADDTIEGASYSGGDNVGVYELVRVVSLEAKTTITEKPLKPLKKSKKKRGAR